jgi:hypothetical protein
MVLFAIVAVDCAAIRALLIHVRGSVELAGLGIVPMVNLLAAGLLIAHRWPASRPFFQGFVVYNAVALTLYLAAVLSFDITGWAFFRDGITLYLRLALDPLVGMLMKRGPLPYLTAPDLLVLTLVAMAWLSLPHVTFAITGGLLSRHGHLWWLPLLVLLPVVFAVISGLLSRHGHLW